MVSTNANSGKTNPVTNIQSYQQLTSRGVFEINGLTVLARKGSTINISDFILKPKYIVEHTIETRYFYDIYTPHSHIPKEIYLTKKMLSDGKDIVNAHLHAHHIDAIIMNATELSGMVMQYWMDRTKFHHVKRGTEHVGIAYVDDKYYFSTPDMVYSIDNGDADENLVCLPQSISTDVIKGYGNLYYNQGKWKKCVSLFSSQVYKLQSRQNISLILGWIHSLPHEYVVRKGMGINSGFPILFTVGEHGSGKTTFWQTLMPYMGISNEEIVEISDQTEFELWKRLTGSYNIPVLYDEYGKPNARMSQQQIDVILSKSFNKTEISRGKTSMSSDRYDIKAPAIVMGQSAPTDASFVDRLIVTEFLKSWLSDSEGLTADGHSANQAMFSLNMNKDKNYHAGMCITQRQMYNNRQIASLVRKYTEYIRNEKIISDPRSVRNVAILMMGLHCYIQMCKRCGLNQIDIGMSMQDVLDIPKYAGQNKSNTRTESDDILEEFLNDLVNFTLRNKSSSTSRTSDILGTGKDIDVCLGAQETYNSKINQKKVKMAAFALNKPCLLINVAAVTQMLKRQNADISYDGTKLRTVINRHMNGTKNENGEGLVLAPSGYVVNRREYTAFDIRRAIIINPTIETLVDSILDVSNDLSKKEILLAIKNPKENDI